MGFDNHYDGLDEYAIRIIIIKAKQLAGKYGFSLNDQEDIEQELALDLLQRLPSYNSNIAQRNTFIARLIDHKIANLIEAQKAACRDHRLCTRSLDEPVEKGVVSTPLKNFIDQEDFLQRTRNLSRPLNELDDIAIDISRILESLRPGLARLCRRLLSGDSITDISRDTGIPRGTLYEAVKKIRNHFEDKGLRDYL